MKKLSIVIPTTGNVKSLQVLLRSLQRLITEYTLQTLVVCNPENVLIDVLQEHYVNLNLVVIQNSEIGVNKARRLGTQRAIHEYILFLDDDCELMDISDVNTLYNEMIISSELFVAGGGYSFEHQHLNAFARKYAKNQMLWLNQGIVDISKNESAYLIGGFFILNRTLSEKNKIYFDPNIIFGGSEKEFFLQAYKKNLKMKLFPVNIRHHYENKFFIYIKKIYKQGRGQRYIENKGLFFKPKYLSNEAESQLSLFDLVFWAGYFISSGEYVKYIVFLLRRISDQLNEKKITTLNKIKKNL